MAAFASLSLVGRIKALLSHSAVYGLTDALARSVALITLPILTHLFTPQHYAFIDFFSVVIVLSVALITFGQDVAMNEYFTDDHPEQTRKQIVTESLLIRLLFGTLFAFAFSYFLPLLQSYHVSQIVTDSLVFWLILLQILAMVTHNFVLNLMKMLIARRCYMFVVLGTALTNISILLIMLLVLKMGIISVFIANAVSYTVFSLIGLYALRHSFALPKRASYAIKQLTLGAPYGMVSIVLYAMSFVERSLVSDLFGNEAMGTYGAAARIAMIMHLAILAFNRAWPPFFLHLKQEQDRGETYDLVLRLFTLCMAAAVCAFSIAAYPLMVLLTPEAYHGASIVILPLCLGLAIQGIGWIADIGILLAKQGMQHIGVSAVFVGVTAVSIILLGQWLGIAGVAWALVVGHSVKAVLGGWFSQRAEPMAWSYKPVIAAVCLLVVWTMGWGALHEHFTLSSISCMSVAASPVLIIGCGLILFSKHERQSALSRLRGRLARQ